MKRMRRKRIWADHSESFDAKAIVNRLDLHIHLHNYEYMLICCSQEAFPKH